VTLSRATGLPIMCGGPSIPLEWIPVRGRRRLQIVAAIVLAAGVIAAMVMR
jgi:hypothetical protein